MSEETKLQTAALSWLYEMEMFSSPAILNNLKENIMLSNNSILDCELLILEDRKEILIHLELNWLSRLLKRDARIVSETEEVLNKLLPSFRKRVVTSREIFDLSLLKVQEYYGGQNAKNNINHSSSDFSSSNSPERASSKTLIHTPPGVLTDSKE